LGRQTCHRRGARRAGRPTLSAEDLVRITLAGDRFDAVAVFGTAGCEDRLVVGDAAHEALAASLEVDPSSDS
jgi:hypothetical protein